MVTSSPQRRRHNTAKNVSKYCKREMNVSKYCKGEMNVGKYCEGEMNVSKYCNSNWAVKLCVRK